MSGHNGFQLLLRLHTPILMPVVVPRLDILLQEALSRLHQDWKRAHALPLDTEPATGIYCASQLIVGVTPQRPLVAASAKLVSSVTRQDLHLASNVKQRFKSVFPDGNRLTSHKGISTPYALFYGWGDADKCAALLSLLSGIGREHARHYGSFDVLSVAHDVEGHWRLRPWPAAFPEGWRACNTQFIEDRLSLMPREAPAPVMRPPRLIREVLHHAS